MFMVSLYGAKRGIVFVTISTAAS